MYRTQGGPNKHVSFIPPRNQVDPREKDCDKSRHTPDVEGQIAVVPDLGLEVWGTELTGFRETQLDSSLVYPGSFMSSGFKRRESRRGCQGPRRGPRPWWDSVRSYRPLSRRVFSVGEIRSGRDPSPCLGEGRTWTTGSSVVSLDIFHVSSPETGPKQGVGEYGDGSCVGDPLLFS